MPTLPPDTPPAARLLLSDLDVWLLADYRAYIDAQARVDALYRDPEAWARRAIANVAGMGPFSADRTIRQYAQQIWQVNPQA